MTDAVIIDAIRTPVGALGGLIDGTERCSWFLPEASPLSARKKWIRGSLKTAGALTVDDGAVRALSAGKSLLPAGVTAVDGEFRRGDVVDVKDRAGRVLARGLVAYPADDARRIGAGSGRADPGRHPRLLLGGDGGDGLDGESEVVGHGRLLHRSPFDRLRASGRRRPFRSW